MIFRLLFIALLVVTLGREVSFAHLIPTLGVEAEFHPQRHYTLRVNLDPRLFLAREPTSLPPVLPAWYLDQNPVARAQTAEQAKSFVNRNLIFKVGDTVLNPEWSISAVDSISSFPLSPNSAETHLLAEYEATLPAVEGDFTLTRTKDCPIGLVLYTFYEGATSHNPQGIFEGESSRGFPLQPAAAQGDGQPPPQSSAELALASSSDGTTVSQWGKLTQAWEGYLPLALVLGCLALIRWPVAVVSWVIFNLVHLLVWAAEQAGLLPPVPNWLGLFYWVALGCAVLQMVLIRLWGAAFLISFAAAGLCHALAHPLGLGGLWHDSGLLALHEMLGATLVAAVGFTLVTKSKSAPASAGTGS